MMLTPIVVLAAALLLAGCAGSAGLGAPSSRSPADHSQLVPGKTTQAEVRTTLGRPDRTLPARAERPEAWGYRFRNGWNEPRIFWLEWSANGALQSTSEGVDNERDRRYRWP